MKKLSILITMLFLANLGFAEKNEADTIKMQNIDEVVISASRTKAKLKELPAKVEVITSRAISQSGAKDLAYLLKSNTSIDLIQYPGFLSGIGIRGFAPGTTNKYVTVFVNGIPAGTANMATLSLSGVNQVEILKGPFSSLYGSQAMGGIINIVSNKNKDKLTGNVDLSYGSWKTMNANVAVGGKITGGLSFDLDAYYHKQGDSYKIGKKNFFDRPEVYETILDKISYGAEKLNTSEKSFGGNLRLGYDFNENWSLDIYGNYFATDDLATGGDIWKNSQPTLKDMSLYGTHVSLKGKINKHNLTFNPYFSKEYNGYLDTKTKKATYESELETYGFQLQDNIIFGKNKLTLGLDNKQETNELNSATPDGVAIAPYKPGYSNGTYGIFVQGLFKLWKDKVNLSAGARYDYMKATLEANEFIKNEKQSENYSVINPNIGLKINIDKHSNIHSSFGTAFLSPDAFKKAGKYEKSSTYNGVTTTSITMGNPDLSPEKSQTFDIGIQYNNLSQGVNFDITYFHSKHKDFISSYSKTINSTATTKLVHKLFKNDSEAKMRGIELLASYDFGALVDYDFSLKAYMNATFMLEAKVLQKDFTTKKEMWVDAEYIRSENINFGLEFMTQDKWSIKLNGRYLGSRYETIWSGYQRKLTPYKNAQGKLKEPAFMVFDASVYYNITKNITVGVNANNILNENYTEKDGYNMPGRNFMAKVGLKF